MELDVETKLSPEALANCNMWLSNSFVSILYFCNAKLIKYNEIINLYFQFY